jgi:hypothetical protein
MNSPAAPLSPAGLPAPRALHLAEKVTLYRTSSLMGNVVRIEAVGLELSREPWAQYADAFALKWRLPRARSWLGTHFDADRNLLILRGWGHLEPDGFLVENGPGSRISRYASFDPRWSRDWSAKVDAYLAQVGAGVVVGDWRDPDLSAPRVPAGGELHRRSASS